MFRYDVVAHRITKAGKVLKASDTWPFSTKKAAVYFMRQFKKGYKSHAKPKLIKWKVTT
jgi:hypothetical protein